MISADANCMLSPEHGWMSPGQDGEGLMDAEGWMGMDGDGWMERGRWECIEMKGWDGQVGSSRWEWIEVDGEGLG